jgi:hypothetical protein
MSSEVLENDHKNFVNKILHIPSITLEHIFRNTKVNVNQICYTIRQWIVDNKRQSFKKYVGNGVYLYQLSGANKNVLRSEWFQKCTEYFKNDRTSSIILTWTNKNSDLYNNTMRKVLLNKDKIRTFEIGDRLILKDFYNFKNNSDTSGKDDTSNNKCFYTSDQIRISNMSIDTVIAQQLSINIPQCIQRLKDSTSIIKKIRIYEKNINDITKRVYKVWKIGVERMPEHDVDKVDENIYDIYVIHPDSNEVLDNDKKNIERITRTLANIFKTSFSMQYNTIEKFIIKQMWKYWDVNFVSPYANVIFGYSITTHKAQGSTFNNVFVDVRDILNNYDTNVAKRCIYTAFSRCSNELHILV